MKPRDK